jgi:hypothetical protein
MTDPRLPDKITVETIGSSVVTIFLPALNDGSGGKGGRDSKSNALSG